MVAVAINVNDPEADALTRKFAHMAGVAISEAIVIATKEAIASAKNPMTSPIAVLEAARGLARPDKFDLSVEAVESLLLEFMDERGIEICDLPPAPNIMAYRSSRRQRNSGEPTLKPSSIGNDASHDWNLAPRGRRAITPTGNSKSKSPPWLTQRGPSISPGSLLCRQLEYPVGYQYDSETADQR